VTHAERIAHERAIYVLSRPDARDSTAMTAWLNRAVATLVKRLRVAGRIARS
jgi:hypothetical protein